jgi:hypothetical protein
MRESMDGRPHHIIVSHAAPDAYAPMTRAILAKLGYAILLPEEHESLRGVRELPAPILRIVDERQLAEIPDDGVAVPLIVLTGRHGVAGVDSRIIGAVRRPAGMHELFRLIQQVTEETPRSTPRVPTHLHARCRREGREWGCTVLSLSENGCLVRTPEPLLLGTRVELSFSLPRTGAIAVEAESAYQLVPDVGMIFHAIPARQREAIAGFVTATLAA